jgi:hypothetical protein
LAPPAATKASATVLSRILKPFAKDGGARLENAASFSTVIGNLERTARGALQFDRRRSTFQNTDKQLGVLQCQH